MRQIETDYLVVGAGASGMAFVDSLLATSDAEVVLVDRRDRPGGHWLDAYPFVRLHQPSAVYGVNSRPLGNDRIDDSGPNAGCYERATAAEICDYFGRVLDDLVGAGRVGFLAMSDYQGHDGAGHRIVSRLTGEETRVVVRRKLVDATYIESSIPSRHTPAYVVDEGVTLIPPNELVNLAEPATDFTVIGAGKTAMDTGNWLLDAGVDPERIQWIRPREPWLFDREYMQPLDLVGSYMQLQARWVEAAVEAEDGPSFAHRLADAGVLVRIDPSTEPDMFRGAIVSRGELEALRRIERVVAGRVVRIGTGGIVTDNGSIVTRPGTVHVDCTAAGVRPTVRRPIFEPDRITIQLVTIGFVPWSASTIGAVEALRDDDLDKNRVCPPLAFSGNIADVLAMVQTGMVGLLARGSETDLAAWNEASRLNPAREAANHLDDPRVRDAYASMSANVGAALRNLADRVGAPTGV